MGLYYVDLQTYEKLNDPMSIARLENVVWVSWVSQGADRKRSANPFTHFVFRYVVDNGITKLSRVRQKLFRRLNFKTSGPARFHIWAKFKR